MNARLALLLPLLAAACGSESTAVVPSPVRWLLSWNDEFDGPAGEPPSGDRWTYDIGGNGWGNNELQYYTDRRENVSQDGNGNLIITARREPFMGREYTSGRILTKGLFDQKFGRVEARMRLPTGQGVWPAFWMLGANIDEVTWPRCGEIDIMEARGQEPAQINGSLHGPGYSAGGAITSSFRLRSSGGFDEDYHVFAVEWDPGRIAFLVDEQVYQVVTASDVFARGPWVYGHSFYLILNVAVGGDYVGPPSPTTPLPQGLVVDYVRVFRRAT